MSVSFSVMSSKKVADLKKLLDENFVEVPFSKKANKVQKYLQKFLTRRQKTAAVIQMSGMLV